MNLEKIVAYIMDKGNLHPYERIITDLVRKIYTHEKKCVIDHDERNRRTVLRWTEHYPNESLIIFLHFEGRSYPEEILWALSHEVCHLDHSDPRKGITQEEELVREHDAWDRAESYLRSFDELEGKFNLFTAYKKWCMATYAPIVISKPNDLPDNLLAKLADIVSEGGQVDLEFVKIGLDRADLISMICQDEIIISTATLKNPSLNYTAKVFNDAKAEGNGRYLKELGYIVTHPEHYKRGFCKKVLNQFWPVINSNNMFATTRKLEMGQVLESLGFKKVGATYKEDLNLYLYDAPHVETELNR